MEKKYVKSPLNYIGGKFKLLPQIEPLFPNDISIFVDLFGGGFNVGSNINARSIIYNDISKPVTEMLQNMYNTPLEMQLQGIQTLIDKYNLSKENKEGFMALRDNYNKNPSPIKLYTLICYAFNNQIRFNKNSHYNMPFGKNRSSFNPKLKERYKEFVTEIQSKLISFLNYDFRQLNPNSLDKNSFVYMDSPYLNSVASYNENGGWTEQDDADLYALADGLNSKGIKFALSNNLKYDNEILKGWMQKYKVHYLKHNSKNCNYQKKDKQDDIEILITNY